MKRYLIVLITVIAAVAAHAETYSFLNFVKGDNTGNSFAATGTKVTFQGGNAIITAGGKTSTMPMGNVAYLEFSNTQLGDAPSWLKGDVNGDGVVDILDVNCLVNIILGSESPDKYQGRAYVNDDNSIDVTDINEIINIILG